jgi:hypothetical protein
VSVEEAGRKGKQKSGERSEGHIGEVSMNMYGSTAGIGLSRA